MVTSEPVSTGGSRTTTSSTAFAGAWGLSVTQQVVSSDAPATCATTVYAAVNAAANLVGSVSEVLTTSGACDQSGTVGADRLISGVRTAYDGAAVGAAPTRGEVTMTEAVTEMSGAAKTWTVASTSVYDGLGRPVEVTDVLGRVSKTAYTPATTGGPTTRVETTNPVGWVSSTVLDPARGAELSVTDENGKVTSATYDALGRRTAVWLPNRAQADNASSPSSAFAYGVSQTQASTVTTKTLIPGGTKTTIEVVDGLGRLVQSQAPAVGSGGVNTDTAYDSQGRTVSTTRPYWATEAPNGKLFVPTSMAQVPSRTDTVFDAAGRTTASVLYTYGDETSRTRYAYPGADRTDMVPPAGGTPTSTFTNSRGEKTKLVQYQGAGIAGAGLATTYEYNPGGKMTGMVDPAGNRWAWQYDLKGNQVVADDPDSGRTVSVYDLAGNVLSTTDARGQVLAYTYDQLNRKTAKYSDSTSGALLASWSFDTLAKGKPTSSTTGAAGADTQCFRYDYLHQLTEAWTPKSSDCAPTPTTAGLGGAAPYWTSYTVDPLTGNRTSTTAHTTAGDTTTSYTYPAAGAARPHAVTSVAGGQYDYDAAGNTVTRPGQTLTWDESGKLASVSTKDGTQSRVYDADGNVLLQTDPKAGTTLFVGETEVTLAPGASAASATRTYSVAGVTVAERSTKVGVSGSTVTWLSGDMNGTQDLAVNQSTGQVTRRFADPYGNARGPQTVWGSQHGYLNKPTSVMTGLTQLGAQAYDPVIGKFLSVDPILDMTDPQQSNGYSYSHNNPVTTSDPSGLKPKTNKSKGKPAAAKSAGAKSKPKAVAGGSKTDKSSAKGSSGKKSEQWWNPWSWSPKTWQKAAAIGAGVVAAVAVGAAIAGAAGCVAVTFGVCGAVILGAGAVGGAVTYGLKPGKKTGAGFASAVASGAVGGIVGGAVGAVAGKALSAVASKVITNTAGNTAAKAETAASSVRAPVRNPPTPLGPATAKAAMVDDVVESTGKPPSGYAGGRNFSNREGALPDGPSYREGDVNPRIPDVDRGGQRSVTGSDGSAYYTPDHYNSFVKFPSAAGG
ncbi:secreted protein [Leifsonia xyli subsp. cynodontis DSM 46306]|uniref:Type IV secretion protein Rhs n=1 Tax=Leifsonia xyli subsp. cynodontis DSM 46306 TaxID=1389489 RepID=U3PC69_LEIXC|nr:secreted protein [Leifsonia xyli subsp. cynodontis DSM 46306]